MVFVWDSVGGEKVAYWFAERTCVEFVVVEGWG